MLKFGGHPEPFLDGTKRFYNRWRNMRLYQLFSEDLRGISRLADIHGVSTLAELLRRSVSSGVNYSSLSNELAVTSETVKS